MNIRYEQRPHLILEVTEEEILKQLLAASNDIATDYVAEGTQAVREFYEMVTGLLRQIENHEWKKIFADGWAPTIIDHKLFSQFEDHLYKIGFCDSGARHTAEIRVVNTDGSTVSISAEDMTW